MFKPSLLFAVVALAFVTGSHAGPVTSFASVTFPYSGTGVAVANVVFVFQPATEVPITGSNTLTITMPTGYFTGTPAISAGKCSNHGSTAGADASSTTSALKFTITGNAIAVSAAVTCTITGLTLGNVMSAGNFALATGVDTTASSNVVAPAIGAVMGVSAFTLQNNGANSPVWPVMTFTPGVTIPAGGTITITFPSAGYFIGTATFPAGTLANFTGAATSAATSASNSIVITIGTAGVASGTNALTITLHGLNLGAVASAGNFVITSSATPGTKPTAAAAIVASPVFTSFTWGVSGGYNIASTAVTVTLTFTPGVAVTTSDFITVTMPSAYFTGSGTFAAGKASVDTMTGSVATSASSNTKFVVTIAVAPTLTTAFTVTITGLSLGAAQAGGYFSLETGKSGAAGTYGMVAPAIHSIITSASITLATNVSGANPSPVLAFTSTGTIAAGGFVTIQMPAGYFLGTAAFVAGNASVGALTGSAPAVTSTSTSIVITTAAGSITTSAFTVTLQGLTLGSAQAAGSFILSTSQDQGFVTKNAPAIQDLPPVVAPPPPKASASVLDLSVALLLSIALALFI